MQSIDETAELKKRLRNVAQVLIDEVGADGPMSTEEAANRAIMAIRDLKGKIQELELELRLEESHAEEG